MHCRHVLESLVFSSLVFMSVSCSKDTDVRAFLHELEPLVFDNPDSAYTAISSFDKHILTKQRDIAHIALLQSIVQDKLYIDVEDDSLIVKAVNYYKKKNNRYTFYSHYYHGRVMENARRREDAMKAFILAESVPSRKVDPLYLAKLHFGKERIYNYLFLDDRALEEAKLAAKYSLEAGHMNNYALAVLDQLAFYLVSNNKESNALEPDYYKADSCLNTVKQIWDQLSLTRQRDWYVEAISLYESEGKRELLGELIEEYLAFMIDSPEKVNWLTVAMGYRCLEMYPELQQALDKGYLYGMDTGREEPSYRNLQASISARDGDYERAYLSLRAFLRLSDKIQWDIYQHDTQFLEERHDNEMSAATSRIRLLVAIIVIMFFFVFSSILAYTLYRRKTEKDSMQEALDQLRDEYDALQSLHARNDEIGQKAIKVLDSRMRTLKSFLEKDNKAVGELNRLSGNRTSILESIGMIYAIYAPRFTELLLDKGLSSAEIGYCCLHLMGYSTKEAGDFICHSAYYNISSKIRSKLEIEANYSTLAKWLKQKYAETSHS